MTFGVRGSRFVVLFVVRGSPFGQPRTPNAERRTPNAERRAPNAERRTTNRNDERRTENDERHVPCVVIGDDDWLSGARVR
jgi:hypothetical protein